MTEEQQMYAKGYRYRIHITENGTVVPPLYVKTPNCGPLLRTSYPNGIITKVEKI